MCSVSQLCPILCDPMNCSLLGFLVCGYFQARILEMGCHFLLHLAVIHEPHLSKVGKKKAHAILNILALIELHSPWPLSSLQKTASTSFFFFFSELLFLTYSSPFIMCCMLMTGKIRRKESVTLSSLDDMVWALGGCLGNDNLPFPPPLLWKWKLLSRVWLFATLWTIQSLEFSRPEDWSR